MNNVNRAPFIDRHIGVTDHDVTDMLQSIGCDSVETLIGKTIPASIRLPKDLALPHGVSEYQALKRIAALGQKNRVYQSCIGQGYSSTILPPVIQRNILENPAWYTAYTPYQAEISQGRLEMLLSFQTMIAELTGMAIANASLLDEATAAAEAMTMFYRSVPREKKDANQFFVSKQTLPQTIAVIKTRAKPLGIEVVIGDPFDLIESTPVFGCLLQYPDARGEVHDYSQLIADLTGRSVQVAVAADLLSLVLLKEPGSLGAHCVVGSTQRFGIPMGFGGPHAAYFATQDQYKRQMPGRLIGESVDRAGNKALRMSLQTREQHIRREKATSNICTSQVLLAVLATAYGIYHGPDGLRAIAQSVHNAAVRLNSMLARMGIAQINRSFFDTLHCIVDDATQLKIIAEKHHCNFHYYADGSVGIALDETTDEASLETIAQIFREYTGSKEQLVYGADSVIPLQLQRTSAFMNQKIFNVYHSEHSLTRYLKRLESKDISLVHSMIPLGSCTMKLNSSVSMLPLSWPEFGAIHPLAPADQTVGYSEMIQELGEYLCVITGFTGISFQPNSGAQGEYAGLTLIAHYHADHSADRSVMLIPASAHGTNPASAALAGLTVVVVACDTQGNIDITDLKKQIEAYRTTLAGMMITYPSTHGVFEETVQECCRLIHEAGGLVYLDGANMNAQVGYTNPAAIGADVCHLNLHKTFAIPHGGGGPGVGPVCVNDILKPYLKDLHVSAAEFGSANILLISYAYIILLGGDGLKKATAAAIINANYLMKKVAHAFPVLYTGTHKTCAHEFIIDCRELKQKADVGAIDIAKRLMDFGFHAPTVSFPVAGTLMIEPTESEDKAELDRFADALLVIYGEITAIIEGRFEKGNNPVANAPHTRQLLTSDTWDMPYSRKIAAYPVEWLEDNKFWPSVSRIDDAHGDRNLICTCS